MAASGIRSFRTEDTEAVVALWRDAGLVVPCGAIRDAPVVPATAPSAP